MSEKQFDTNALLDAMLPIIREAGKGILSYYNPDINVDLKADKSPITEADRLSHRRISEGLENLGVQGLEGIPILSEEGSHIPYKTRSTWKYYWLVDPLDGTKEFIKRNGEFTINIALMKDSAPFVGFLFVPLQGLFYWAVRGEGAYKLRAGPDLREKSNEAHDPELPHSQRIRSREECSTPEKGERLPLGHYHDRQRKALRIVASRSHRSEATDNYIEKIREYFKGEREIEIVSAGSALKFSLLAERTADVYPRFSPCMEWDTAAAQIIAEESGCYVYDVDQGSVLSYNKQQLTSNSFIVARDKIFKKLISD